MSLGLQPSHCPRSSLCRYPGAGAEISHLGEIAEHKFGFLSDILQAVSVWKSGRLLVQLVLLKFCDCIHDVTSQI